jgi:hypothetical protein
MAAEKGMQQKNQQRGQSFMQPQKLRQLLEEPGILRAPDPARFFSAGPSVRPARAVGIPSAQGKRSGRSADLT